jgi:hypothetical protein
VDSNASHASDAGSEPSNQSFHPAMMVKVSLQVYATGVVDSGKIAMKLQEDGTLRVLGAGNDPKHRVRRSRIGWEGTPALFAQMMGT